jgi:hypothetical protein
MVPSVRNMIVDGLEWFLVYGVGLLMVLEWCLKYGIGCALQENKVHSSVPKNITGLCTETDECT